MIITVAILHRTCIRSLAFAQGFVFSTATTGFGISYHLTVSEKEIILLTSPHALLTQVREVSLASAEALSIGLQMPSDP